jgi:dihydrofolate reductase
MSNGKIRISAIVAMCDANQGIGLNGRLPWSLPEEFRYYINAITRTQDPNKRNALVFGRFTWHDWCAIFQSGMPDHVYIIISSTFTKDQLDPHVNPDTVHICKSYHDAIQLCLDSPLKDSIESIYVNGNMFGLDSLFSCLTCLVLFARRCADLQDGHGVRAVRLSLRDARLW